MGLEAGVRGGKTLMRVGGVCLSWGRESVMRNQFPEGSRMLRLGKGDSFFWVSENLWRPLAGPGMVSRFE